MLCPAPLLPLRHNSVTGQQLMLSAFGHFSNACQPAICMMVVSEEAG